MDSGRLFGGMMLVCVGALLLFINLGVASSHVWWNLLSLSPLLLVAIGLRLVFRRGPLAVLSPLVLAAMVLLAVFVPPGFDIVTVADKESQWSQALEQGTTSGALEMNIGAAKVNIGGAEVSTDLVRVRQKYAKAPIHWSYSRSDGTATITATENERGRVFVVPFGISGAANVEDIALNESIPWEIEINSGATTIDADLSRLEVTRLDISSGASKVEIKMGGRAARATVNIDVAASSVTLTVPKDVGLKIDRDLGLGMNNLSDLGFERNGEFFTSPGYAQATHFIDVTMSMAVTTFRVEFSEAAGLNDQGGEDNRNGRTF